MNAYDNPEWYDSLLFGTTRSPGTVKFTGHDQEWEWDVKSAKGQESASSTLVGKKLTPFQAEFYLADREEIEAWPAFQRLLESTVNGVTPNSVPLYHPDLAENRINEASVAGIGGQRHDGRGGVLVLVKFQTYKPPKPKPAKATAPKPAARVPPVIAPGIRPQPKPDPNDAAKRELASLLEDAKQP